MDFSKNQSKLQNMLQDTHLGYTSDEIIHIACDCLLCMNDVRPLQQPEQPRQRYPDETYLQSSESFFYLLKKSVGFRGYISLPEIIFLQEGMLFYSSDLGRLRCKDKISNQEGKKFFDERRNKLKAGKNSDKDSSYILVYKSGTQQVLTESHYNKILGKRKNDPFWLQVAYSYKLPESRYTQVSLKTFTYVRTKRVGQKMISTMEKVVDDIDNYQQKVIKDEAIRNVSMVSVDQNMQNSIVMNNSQLIKNQSKQFHQQLSSEHIHDINTFSAIFKTNKSKFRSYIPTIKNVIQQIIAYIQAVHKVRILQLQIDYSQIQFEAVITGVKKLLVCQVPKSQQCYLHDRYKPLEEIGTQQLIQLKKQYDKSDEQTLWAVCSQVLESCLEHQKIKLNIQDYQKPSKQKLKEIFESFFPQFSPAQIFQRMNWKNQMPKFLQERRKKINHLLESDEGISILKRFGIYFFRTFQYQEIKKEVKPKVKTNIKKNL